MSILNSIVSWINIKRLNQITLFKEYPGQVQEEVLRKLLEKAKNTQWGKAHGYSDIRSVGQFQNKVPVQKYEQVQDNIQRLRQGEQNLLWPGEIKWFAKSSGTTNDRSKYIPLTKESIEDCHFRGGRDVLALYTEMFPETRIFKGKSLTLGGSHQINNFSNESFYGDLSAILLENMPYWTNFIRTPETKIALIDKWEEKLEKMTRVTVNENVTSFAGVPSWFLVLIKHILEHTGKSNVLELWPNLELFIHGGVNFTPYREQYKKLIPSKQMNYLETYNASEGFFAIQDDLNDPGMLLMLDYGIFYEFIPMDEFHLDNPKAIPLVDVELDKNYAMVISTNGGLWRYLIGDTVKFVSRSPYKLVITGRTKHFINAFGEELIIENAENALRRSCEITGAVIKEYTAAPVFMDDNAKAKHQWMIEFEKMPDNLERFSNEMDNALRSLNSDYDAKRYKDITLDKPEIIVGSHGLFYRWMKKKNKLGGQNKVPRLANNREYIDDLIELNNS